MGVARGGGGGDGGGMQYQRHRFAYCFFEYVLIYLEHPPLSSPPP